MQKEAAEAGADHGLDSSDEVWINRAAEAAAAAAGAGIPSDDAAVEAGAGARAKAAAAAVEIEQQQHPEPHDILTNTGNDMQGGQGASCRVTGRAAPAGWP